jgi:hypothetical protein
MSAEIKINISNTLQNPSTSTTGALKDSFAPGSISVTQSSQLLWSEAITMTTSDTLIGFTGVVTPGYCMLQNLDASNYVTYGPNNAGSILVFGRLKPGEVACFRLDASLTSGFRFQANTASCKVLVKIWSD